MKLDDKVCIITGASSGIGKATAHLFANEGAKLGSLYLWCQNQRITKNKQAYYR